MSPRPGLVATRRTALAGVFGGAVVLAGCDADGSRTTASSGASPAAATTSAAPEEPDQSLVDQVVAELDELIAFTAAAAAARPRIGPLPSAFEALHREHRAVLTDEPLDLAEPTRVRGPANDLRQRLTRREAAAQRQFASWAVAAESGPLARLLASISAAIAQRLAAPVKALG